MYHKILIANRGEIAVRIIRACREMGIATVAVYSTADKEALHTQLADEAVCIGEAASKDSYLNVERIISAAIATKAEAIHPGFGFLSENAKFAEVCTKCGLEFIGPPAEVISKMGDKAMARDTMTKAQVPVTPGSKEPVFYADKALLVAKEIGFPVMIKAAYGGGGKGMRVALDEAEFESQFLIAQTEAKNGFGNGTMYIEKYITNPKHVEMQLLCDKFGNVAVFPERDCSVQRNHQKMIEESPSPAVKDSLRKKMASAAAKAAKAVGYVGAGTIEFLLNDNGEFYFMEMNTRIQVEHPVTEMVSGVDLIKEMIRISAGEKLSVDKNSYIPKGHAIECRINAENPQNGFRPSPGKIDQLHLPGGFNIRVDSAMYPGCEVSPYYDSMIAKLIVKADNREDAIDKMLSALGEVIIEGVDTNIDFQYDILSHPVFRNGYVTTDFIKQHFSDYIK